MDYFIDIQRLNISNKCIIKTIIIIHSNRYINFHKIV